MRRHLIHVTFCLSLSAVPGLPAGAADHTAPPVQDAVHYPAVDNHPAEQVAIAADPYNTRERAAIFRIPYLDHNVMPIRVIVTNNGDKPISLADARIDFITASGDKIPAAEPQDIDRILSRPSNPNSGYKVGPITLGKHKAKDKEVQEDFDTYEYAALAVEPHSTRAGFLFYDLQDDRNPLQGARLELRRLKAADGKELFAFEVPFDKYLASGASAAKQP